MISMWRDLQYALRILWKAPGFTIVAVLSLALGIGANTSIFTLLDALVLRPLPVERPGELMTVEADGAFSYPNYRDFRDLNDVLAGLAAYRFAPMSLSRRGTNERVWGYLVTGNYFNVLGVRALHGRTFLPEEDQTPGAAPVAVLSHGCWQRRFNADPQIIGQTVSLNNHDFTVVGIMPENFNGTDRVFGPDAWVPLMMQREIEPGNDYLESRGDGRLFVFGRLKPGVSAAQAQSSLTVLAQNLARAHPLHYENEGTSVELVSLGITSRIRPGVIGFTGAIMGIVLLVLALACTNLANLLLTRSTGRRKEIAIRLALGASRGRLMRQLLTESVLLSIAGGAGGLLLALWINDLALAIKPPIDFSILIDLHIDLRVLGFTLFLSVLTGILFGIAPALQATRPNLVASLKDESSLAGFTRSRLRNALVIGQMALSVLLLVCAGLVLRSLQQAQTMDPGFQAERAVAMSVDVGLQGYDKRQGEQFYQQLTERVAALPEVESVALANKLPLSLNHSTTTVFGEGQVLPPGAKAPGVYYVQTGPGYFSTMKIPLIEGHEFKAADREGTPSVCIINETLARRLFPVESAIGKRVSYGSGEGPYTEVIGVAKDGKYMSLGETPRGLIYQPLLQHYNNHITLIARTRTNAAAAVPAIRHVVQSLDETLPVYGVKTLTDHLGVSLLPARAAAVLLGSFGFLVLVLAALGIYGVMSYVVAGRTREIGVRMALGAQSHDVLRLIVKQGMVLAVAGVCVGLAAAFAATRLLTSLLYGVSAGDPLTFVGVTLLLVAVAFLASYLPARRATRIDPMAALRHE